MILRCSEKKQTFISGKYNFVEEYYIANYDDFGDLIPPNPPYKDLGFNFYSKDSCESNRKYFDAKSFDVDYFKVELGRKTIYKIEKDSLKIFNRTLEKWESYYILHCDKNNLTLFDGSKVKSYAKKFKH